MVSLHAKYDHFEYVVLFLLVNYNLIFLHFSNFRYFELLSVFKHRVVTVKKYQNSITYSKYMDVLNLWLHIDSLV